MALASTRERILDAAAHVMSTKGLTAATTKEIARAAGFSEAALYKHFQDKEELFLCVLSTRLPPLIALLAELPERAGRGTVTATLEEVARAAVAFYDRSVPIAASLFADPQLLARHRERIGESGAGPQRPSEALTAYLRAEQRLGRLSRSAKPAVAAGAEGATAGCMRHCAATYISPRPHWAVGRRRAVAGLRYPCPDAKGSSPLTG